MRKIGIDFGTKRIGIALSDESGTMAFPHSVIKNDATLLSVISKLVKEKKVSEIIIGHSLDKNGSTNKLHTLVEAFIVDLTVALGLPVHLEPEQYSTQQALRIQGKTAVTDAAAAAIILNSYLTKQK